MFKNLYAIQNYPTMDRYSVYSVVVAILKKHIHLYHALPSMVNATTPGPTLQGHNSKEIGYLA